jgi:hypothetical protein
MGSQGMTIRPYRPSELARLYRVDKKTFLKWIQPFLEEIGKRHGQFYTNAQVRIIFLKLDPPE